MAKYVGWGGLSQAFSEDDAAWMSEHKLLQELFTKEEYLAARATVTDAFYTDQGIASTKRLRSHRPDSKIPGMRITFSTVLLEMSRLVIARWQMRVMITFI